MILDILALVMSYTTPPQKWQIKQKFKHFLKKTHQNPEVSDPEMAVFKSHPFISASPDL